MPMPVSISMPSCCFGTFKDGLKLRITLQAGLHRCGIRNGERASTSRRYSINVRVAVQ